MAFFSAFPYFPTMNVDFSINRLHVFNLWQLKDKYIEDSLVKQKVEQFCALYVDSNLETVSTLALAVFDGNYDFRPMSDEEIRDLQRYALALLFCSVIRNEQNSVCVSEQFNLFHQSFDPTQDSIAYSTGSYYRVLNWQSLGQTKLVRPEYVPTETLLYRFDEKLFGALCNMIDARRPEDDSIIRALEWVRYAHMNAEGIGNESRLVMMTTAFETLFNLPRRDKTFQFSNRLEQIIKVDQLDVYANTKIAQIGLSRTQRLRPDGTLVMGNNNQPLEWTMYGWWARDLYDLRSKIVHGDVLTPADFRNHNNIQYFHIALHMMQYCLFNLLEDKGFLTFKTFSLEGAQIPVEKYSVVRRLRKIEQAIS